KSLGCEKSAPARARVPRVRKCMAAPELRAALVGRGARRWARSSLLSACPAVIEGHRTAVLSREACGCHAMRAHDTPVTGVAPDAVSFHDGKRRTPQVRPCHARAREPGAAIVEAHRVAATAHRRTAYVHHHEVDVAPRRIRMDRTGTSVSETSRAALRSASRTTPRGAPRRTWRWLAVTLLAAALGACGRAPEPAANALAIVSARATSQTSIEVTFDRAVDESGGIAANY